MWDLEGIRGENFEGQMWDFKGTFGRTFWVIDVGLEEILYEL